MPGAGAGSGRGFGCGRWFDSWSDVARILAVGAGAYLTLVVLLRVSGKRTLAELNAFDRVVSVAFGSTLATILLSSDVSWSEGAVALVLLAALQFVVARTTTWLPGGRSVVTARPTLLLEDGRPIFGALDRQRVTMSELRRAIRSSGSGDLSSVAAVVLESDGSAGRAQARRSAGPSSNPGRPGRALASVIDGHLPSAP